MKPWVLLGAVVVAGLAVVIVSQNGTPNQASANSLTFETNVAAGDYAPVEESMHEFMEYYFEPGYKRLKPAMENDSPDRQAWKAIKGDSLMLAEGGNLLMMRKPSEDVEAWNEAAKAVRDHGAELYQAAKEGNRENALTAYKAMINNCNRCHDSHADGKHQLK